MNTLALWIPPKSDSIYWNPPYLYCHKCSQTISAGTVIGLDSNDLQRLSTSDLPYNAECTTCAIKTFMLMPNVRESVFEVVREELKYGQVLKEMVREELKTIIKEEVYDPNGTFSPDGPK